MRHFGWFSNNVRYSWKKSSFEYVHIGSTKLVGSPCKRDAVLLMLLTLYLIFDAEDTKMQECFFSFPTSLYFLLKNIVEFTVFENHRKSRIQHCERSELRLQFEWTKVNQKWQNGPFWRVFENLKLVVRQC